MEEEKMKRVLKWPTLKGVKDIQKFLELANYYQQFIKDFVMIARLLHNLVKKELEVGLDRKAEESISEVKRDVYKKTSVSNTRFRQKNKNESRYVRLYNKRVLSIEYKDRKQRPIAFLSTSLNKTEKNYEIYNKEILVVIRELEFIKTQKLNRR